MENTAIAWCDHTANFWWGCEKVSQGCKHCYAETLSKRYGKSIWGPAATTTREGKKAIWKDILKWDREAGQAGIRQSVFVQSMSDFLEDHPMVDEWRKNAMVFMENLKNLDVLMLTKRPENAPRFLARWYDNWPAHVWMGATAEDQENANKRIPLLLEIPAAVRFLSVEPMIGPVSISAAMPIWSFPEDHDIHWIIAGGESGPGCRPMSLDWARDLRDECWEGGAKFFMKQIGGHPNKRDHLEDLPADLQIREFPR